MSCSRALVLRTFTRSCVVSMAASNVSVVLGLQWGDEGKGKLVDILSQTSDYCCRFAGGNNAGHTVAVGGDKYDFHLLPR